MVLGHIMWRVAPSIPSSLTDWVAMSWTRSSKRHETLGGEGVINAIERERFICEVAKFNTEKGGSDAVKGVVLLVRLLKSILVVSEKKEGDKLRHHLVRPRVGNVLGEFLNVLKASVCRWGSPYLEWTWVGQFVLLIVSTGRGDVTGINQDSIRGVFFVAKCMCCGGSSNQGCSLVKGGQPSLH
jgi:hypothetical protein